MQGQREMRDRPAGAASPERRLALLGIRMTPELAVAVKVEAAQRTMTVADLFEEIWRDYIARKGR